jgi:hypothetical protein
MIPSRSLSLVEIISETIRTSVRIFGRYGILFLILSVPGVCLTTIGITNFATSAISSARRDINFGDSSLIQFREDTKSLLAAQNPLLFPDRPRRKDTLSSSRANSFEEFSASSRQLGNYIGANISRFASPLAEAIIGFVLLLFGMIALAGATVDLSCRDFEERPLELWRSLFDSLKRNAWKILLLYIIYVSANGIADSIANVIPGEAGNMLGGFITIAEIYMAIRLIVTVPSLVSEEIGPFKALARSWHLTRRSGWRIFGISLLFGLMLFSVSTIVSIVAGFAFTGVADWASEFFGSGPITVAWLLESLPGFLASAAAYVSVLMLVVLVLLPAFGTILYYDLRTRRDGPLVYLDERA